MPKTVEFHSDYRHDFTDHPNGDCDEYKATRPYPFRKGDTATLCDELADALLKAGVASLPGEQPSPPAAGPVQIQPVANVVHGQKTN